MRREPEIDRAGLAAVLRAEWALEAVELSHIPSGEYAFCFRAETPEGRFFVKTWPEPRPGHVSSESTLAMLRLTRELYDRGAFTAQAAPIPTRTGSLHTTLDGRLLAVFPVICGGPPVESASFAAAFGRSIRESAFAEMAATLDDAGVSR